MSIFTFLFLLLNQLQVYQFQVLAYNFAAAKVHAFERARLTSRGLSPSFVDGQIAAIAGVNQLTLVTRNVKDFRGYDNLTIDNWFND